MAKNEFDSSYNSISFKFGKEFDDNQISYLNDVMNDKKSNCFQNKKLSVSVTKNEKNIYNILSCFSQICRLFCHEDNFYDPNPAQIETLISRLTIRVNGNNCKSSKNYP